MIVEHRTYKFHPGGLPAFMTLYTPAIRTLQIGILGNLIGYFVTEIGPLNQTIHLWGYDSYEERARRRAELTANEEWRAFFSAILPLLAEQETRLLNPTPFSPIR